MSTSIFQTAQLFYSILSLRVICNFLCHFYLHTTHSHSTERIIHSWATQLKLV